MICKSDLFCRKTETEHLNLSMKVLGLLRRNRVIYDDGYSKQLIWKRLMYPVASVEPTSDFMAYQYLD
jgi:hypothetical protein